MGRASRARASILGAAIERRHHRSGIGLVWACEALDS
jgi:hypothetical protein